MTLKVTDPGYRRFSDAMISSLTIDDTFSAYLDTVQALIPAAVWGMYEFAGPAQAVVDVRSTVSGRWLEEYEEIGRDDDPILEFVVNERRPIDSSRAVSPERWETSGARRALRREGLAHSLEAPLIVGGALFGTINLARPYTHSPFSETDLEAASIVSAQLSLALERALRHEAVGRRVTTLERSLDRLTHAVIVTNLVGQLLFQNRVAHQEWPLALGSDGTLLPSALSDCIAEALHEFRTVGKRVFVRNLVEPATGRRVIVKSYRLSEKDATAVTLVLPSPDEATAHQLPAWSVLTRREHQIAQLISEGLTTKQISARAYISENTIKQHLKRAFTKTGVNSRAELIQLIWAAGSLEPRD